MPKLNIKNLFKELFLCFCVILKINSQYYRKASNILIIGNIEYHRYTLKKQILGNHYQHVSRTKIILNPKYMSNTQIQTTEHIPTVFEEVKLNENVVCRNFRLTTKHGAIEGKTFQS